MEGKVTYLLPMEQVALPEALRRVSVSPEQVENALTQLSLRYARWTQARQAAAGDAVYCRGEYPDGRIVLLYPGMGMPGAEALEAAVAGKTAGDCFTAEFAANPVKLTVEKILRPIPAQVDDALIAGLGIDGVATVDGYRDYILHKMHQDAKMEQDKMAVGFVLEQLEQNSTFAYDPAELDAYLAAHREQLTGEYRQAGLEPTEEELREGILGQQKLIWLARAVCRQRGVAIDRMAAEEEAAQMAQMLELMGEPVDRDTLLREALDSACISELFGCIEAHVAQCTEG